MVNSHKGLRFQPVTTRNRCVSPGRQATQVIWECKNEQKLTASDFQQVADYMNPQVGNFSVVCFRGKRLDRSHYYEHIRRIAHQFDGMVLLLTDDDLKVFVRQAMYGKIKENHIREIYDETQRKIS